MGSGNIKKFELKLGRSGLIIVIGGMTVLLCLSFILGVGVGKNIDTFPEKISSMPQQVLALFWRPAKVAGGQKVMAGKAAEPDKSNMDLTFHNALTSPKTPSIQQLPAQEKRPDSALVAEQKVKLPIPPVVLTPQEEGVPPREESSEKKVPAREKSPAEKDPKMKEVEQPVHTAGARYLIHVTSLKDKTKALQINKTVATLGYPSKIVKTDIKGKGTWYRVMVTGFETKTLAQTAADTISKKVKTKCVIRPVGADEDRNQ